MPCYDPRNDASYVEEHEVKPLREKLDKVEAMLCGIMTVLESKPQWNQSMFESIDYKEVGLNRAAFTNWFEAHKVADIARKRVEARNKQIKRQNSVLRLKELRLELKKLEQELES